MKNENQPYWSTSVTLPDFSILTEDLTTEIAVVGAGMAGILTAYQLAKQGKKVTVIEARKVLEGTTAHTTMLSNHGIVHMMVHVLIDMVTY
ncbi:FAD-dependent oxidoreductase [Macrococcoides bohemicum]|nr:FAD-dependent oxidoreductase [Macrococcus bohemicus]